MELNSIKIAIINFLHNNILAEDVSISSDTILRDIGIDSYSIVEIVLFIERQYGFVVPDSSLKPENFVSVDAISVIVHDFLKNN